MTQNPSIIFLNDKKTLVALDRTFVGHARTEIYDLVYRAKYSADENRAGPRRCLAIFGVGLEKTVVIVVCGWGVVLVLALVSS